MQGMQLGQHLMKLRDRRQADSLSEDFSKVSVSVLTNSAVFPNLMLYCVYIAPF